MSKPVHMKQLFQPVILTFVFLLTACNLSGNIPPVAYTATPVVAVKEKTATPIPSATLLPSTATSPAAAKEKTGTPIPSATLVPPTVTPEEAEPVAANSIPDGNSVGPVRTSISYSILLCKFSDTGTPSKTVDYFRDMFINKGTHGLNDYWPVISYGNIDLAGSVIKGWYTEPFTEDDAKARSKQNRDQPWHDCIDAAKNAPTGSYVVPKDGMVIVITDPGIDEWGSSRRGAMLPSDIDISGAAHELGHTLGLNHSYSDSTTYRNASWSNIGEYDDEWDVMSAVHVFHVKLDEFRTGGPGLNVFNLDRLGWLKSSRILTFGADGVTTKSVTLAALNHPEATGLMQVRVPFDPADPFHYYTVEFLRKDGWDAGILGDAVLIHEVKRGEKGEAYLAYLLRANDEPHRPSVQSLNANGVTISIGSMSPQTNQATVTITTKFSTSEGNFAKNTQGPNTCKPGYFWRMADEYDYVCVTAEVRDQTRADNAQAASRRSPAGGCLKGYVPRKAFSSDNVCVTPAVQSQVQNDNAEAGSRVLQPIAADTDIIEQAP